MENRIMTFTEAIQATLEGKRMTNGTETNGELEELEIIMDCPFMMIARPGQKNSSSKIAKTPTVEDVLSGEWREI